MPDSGNTVAGYYSPIFEGYVAVGSPLSNYDGEVAAMSEAAKHMESMQPARRVVFLIDCQAAIKALSSNSSTDYSKTNTCRQKLAHLLDWG
jgi:hypothetical protein